MVHSGMMKLFTVEGWSIVNTAPQPVSDGLTPPQNSATVELSKWKTVGLITDGGGWFSGHPPFPSGEVNNGRRRRFTARPTCKRTCHSECKAC
jgi:hypothetical protein